MEIHAPEGPLNSFKDILLHLGVITVGILIALSLEGVVEWRHHKSLVREARENIQSEIRDNERELNRFLRGLSRVQHDQEQIVQFLDDVLASRKSEIQNLRLGFGQAELNSTSWTTAQTVGALNFMSYQEVKKYARTYQLQNEFVRLESNTTDQVVSAITLFAENKDPRKAAADDLRAEKQKVLAAISALSAQNQVGVELEKRYDEVLAGRR